MKKLLLSIFILSILSAHSAQGQVLIDTVSSVTSEKTNTEFCFNNTKLMAGNNTTDRYLIYSNTDTIFLNVFQSGIWTRKIAHTGSNIKSATLTFYKDTIWICWKEGAFIKTRFTPDKGTSWDSVLPVSPAGNVAAPSIYASNNGKIHFVWSEEGITDTIVYYRVFYNGSFIAPADSLSNPTSSGFWPSVIATGDTILCAWKEGVLPSKVWFSRSFNGGVSWDSASSPPGSLPASKDPNLAYAYDSITNTHYTFLAYDYQNKILFQRSTDFGNSWSIPDTVSNPNKLSQFAHLECNNNGFVGISYEHRTVPSNFDDTKKDVGFVYSTSWGQSGSFGNDSLAYTNNPFGSAYPGFNKIDENNFYLAWLTKDTINNKMNVFERLVHFNTTTGITFMQNTNSSISVFPNPFSLQTVLQSEIHLNNATITIYNLFGQTVKEIKNIYGQLVTLQRDNLPSGLYFVRLTQDNKVIATKKLVITD